MLLYALIAGLLPAALAVTTPCLPSGDETAINSALTKGTSTTLYVYSAELMDRWEGRHSDSLPGLGTSPELDNLLHGSPPDAHDGG